MSKEVTEIINALCEKLGIVTSVLVPEIAKYNIARLAFSTAVYTIITTVIAVVVIKQTRCCLNSMESGFEDAALLIFLVDLIPGIVMVFSTIFAVSNATDLIGWIASPTASAVKEITSMIK